MKRYTINVISNGIVIEQITLSEKDEAMQVAEVLRNITDYNISCSWE